MVVPPGVRFAVGGSRIEPQREGTMTATQTKTTLTAREICRVFHVSKDTCYANVESLGGFRLGRRVMFPVGRVANVMGLSEERLLELVATMKNGQGYR
jgi:hypothetical protein